MLPEADLYRERQGTIWRASSECFLDLAEGVQGLLEPRSQLKLVPLRPPSGAKQAPRSFDCELQVEGVV